MKKILFSLAVISLVSVAAVGATRAYFTSTVSIPNVTLGIGTLHIKDSSADWMLPVTFTNVQPGSYARKWVILENDGNMDVGNLTVTITNVVDPDNLLGTVQEWTYGRIVDSTDDINGEQTTPGAVPAITQLTAPGASLLSAKNPVLHPGQKTFTQVQFYFPETMGNEWQGKTATFNLVYHAEQSH